MKILLADDSLDTRELYNMAFRLRGHEVHLACDGIEAVEAFQAATSPQQRFDIIVMDFEMPRMSGWKAVTDIRQMAHGQDTPIVMLTAYYATKLHGELQENGEEQTKIVDVVLSKPIMPDVLLQIMETLVEFEKVKDFKD